MSSDWTLVTGANGFIGSRLVRRLVEKGQPVKAFVRVGSSFDALRDLPEDMVRIAVGDCRYQDRVYAALRGCKSMYHVAGTYDFEEDHRARVMGDVVEGTESVLEAARRASIGRIVVTSSAVTLGARAEAEPLDETDFATDPAVNSYFEAKIAAERIALRRAKDGQDIVIVNPASVFGPGDAKPTPSGRLILNYLQLSPSFKVPIVPGGFGVVDVDDVADAHVAAMQKGQTGHRYALASENVDNRAFYQMLADITGLSEPGSDLSLGQAKWLSALDRVKAWWQGGSQEYTSSMLDALYGRYFFVSSDKAKNELGFTPRSARKALSRACHYFIDHGYVDERCARRARLELRAVS